MDPGVLHHSREHLGELFHVLSQLQDALGLVVRDRPQRLRPLVRDVALGVALHSAVRRRDSRRACSSRLALLLLALRVHPLGSLHPRSRHVQLLGRIAPRRRPRRGGSGGPCRRAGLACRRGAGPRPRPRRSAGLVGRAGGDAGVGPGLALGGESLGLGRRRRAQGLLQQAAGHVIHAKIPLLMHRRDAERRHVVLPLQRHLVGILVRVAQSRHCFAGSVTHGIVQRLDGVNNLIKNNRGGGDSRLDPLDRWSGRVPLGYLRRLNPQSLSTCNGDDRHGNSHLQPL
mmetsp:Transcript_34614/g.84737  ORF Transcript_34614/g.84737 Transcript_34614/m.84737 type:complete len:286 (-) Transcript_34614:94-951(-)